MDILIVTGLSGAGKSKAVDALEDVGYFCIDNLPAAIIAPTIELFLNKYKGIEKFAIVSDVRSADMFDEFEKTLCELKEKNIQYKTLFLTAAEEVLLKRYKENRRKHPLVDKCESSLEKAVRKEIQSLAKIKQSSDYIIDTSELSVAMLKEKISAVTLSSNLLLISVVSFGFKNGIPLDIDMLYDVRCLPNPFYDINLRYNTGLEKAVKDYVFSEKQSFVFLDKIIDFLNFSLPLYQQEGKSQLVIAIGCTGGQHRSVAMVEAVVDFLKSNNYNAISSHRDIKTNDL